MKLSKFSLMLTFTLLAFMVSSCNDEPEIQTGVMYEDTGLTGSFTIRDNSSNLLSVLINYPEIRVESRYSNITTQPIIDYVGQVESIEDIIITTERNGSPTETLKDNGGYIISLGRYKAGVGSGEEKIIVRMFVKLKYDEEGEPAGVNIQYQVAY